ncbi:Thioredoxin-like fold [Pseudocohnilembus persalinus]|uniref:Protein disulfide-isomerase n=1 Tax=Pseudocohnilembus persalinus TaxID=266149 RepID=A0A0V0R3H3_PSEPJ|nr:Thioredoxin-like fold [Pseudocohnilembus persalinus]|eukprot:KRX09006.1 Thioredoxin-like fold [Pseudocohnilembus persalinus]
MKTFVFLVLVLSVFFVNCTEYEKEDGVVVLNDENFNSFIESNNFVLVEFYAPWCGHCQQLAPEFAKAAQELAQADPAVMLAKIDATQNEKLAQQYEIQGFPTLFWIVDGQIIQYQGGREASQIVKWCQKQSGSPTNLIESAESLEKLKSDSEVLIIYFGASQDEEQFQAYQNVARLALLNNVVFAHVFDSDIRKAEGTAEKQTIVMFKQFEDPRVEYQGNFEVEDLLSNFVMKYGYPIIMALDEDNISLMVESQNGSLLVFHNNADLSQQALKALQEAKDQIKEHVKLFTIDISSEIGQNLAEFFQITEDKLPKVAIVKVIEEVQKFFLDEEISKESLENFVQKYNKNELKAVYFSEDIPATQDKPVYQLVGKSFNEQVLESEKTVFVKFYAPWCGHCQEMAPVYEQLAEHYKDNENILIADIDFTKNEVPGVEIEGFPTLLLYVSGNKQKPADYYGDRSLEDMIQFIRYHTDSEFKKQIDEQMEREQQQQQQQQQQQEQQQEQEQLQEQEKKRDDL